MLATRRACAFVIGFAGALLSCAAPPAAAQQCPLAVDQAQLQLGYDNFDAAGWRGLLTDGCVDAAVALLEAYRSANSSRLNADQSLELAFHLGQTLAFAGRDQESVRYFEQARGGGEEWAAYVEATLAFLKHDVVGLAAQRARYERAPGSSQMRLLVIDGFILCADRAYAQAAMCAMAH